MKLRIVQAAPVILVIIGYSLMIYGSYFGLEPKHPDEFWMLIGISTVGFVITIFLTEHEL